MHQVVNERINKSAPSPPKGVVDEKFADRDKEKSERIPERTAEAELPFVPFTAPRTAPSC